MNLNFGGNWFSTCCGEKNDSFVVIGSLEGCFSLNKLIWCFMNWEIMKNKNNFCRLTGGTLGLHGRNPTEGSAGSVGSNSGIPRIYTGGTHLRDPPVPPHLKNKTVRLFDHRDDFQIFRKFLKTKLKFSTD